MATAHTPHIGRGVPHLPHEWEGWSPTASLLDTYFTNLNNGNNLDIKEIYRFELNRLKSFIDWPNSSPAYPTKLAKAGLYYNGDADTVCCFICSVEIGQWRRGDDPFAEHRKHSPSCRFITGQDQSNIPLAANTSGSRRDIDCPGDIQETGACAESSASAVAGTAGSNQAAAAGTDVPDSVTNPEPKEMALIEFQSLLDKYPYTSLNTDKIQNIVEKFKRNTSGPQDNAYANLPKDIAKIELQSLLDKYPYTSLNTDKIRGILLNFEENTNLVRRNGYFSEQSRNHAATGAASQDNPRSAEVEDGSTSSPSGELRVDEGENISRRYDERPGTPLQSDAFPIEDRKSAGTATKQPRTENISVIGEAMRMVLETPVMTGLQEHCPKEELVMLAQSAISPQYTHINERLKTFTNWTASHMQEGRKLAEAGYYYTGQEDRVRCFFCNGGLCNWEKEDIPWYEHERWFGRCKYLMKCKEHSPVVKAMVDTAKTIHETVPAPHTHTHEGRTQCDTQVESIWNNEYVKQALNFGYSREGIQGVVNQKGKQVLANLNGLLDALLEYDQHNSNKASTKQHQISTSPPETTVASHKSQSEDKDVESLRKENEELKSMRMCKVCMTQQVSIIFLPCSHLVCCLECGLRVDKCPVCRDVIKATSRVYL